MRSVLVILALGAESHAKVSDEVKTLKELAERSRTAGHARREAWRWLPRQAEGLERSLVPKGEVDTDAGLPYCCSCDRCDGCAGAFGVARRLLADEDEDEEEGEEEEDDDDAPLVPPEEGKASDEKDEKTATGDHKEGTTADALKRPQSAFFLWQGKNRERVQQLVGSKDVKAVASKLSELWKEASPDEKAPFEAEAKKQKEAFEEYIKTPEGQKAFEDKKAGESDKKKARGEKKQAKIAKEEKKESEEKKTADKSGKADGKDKKAAARETKSAKTALKTEASKSKPKQEAAAGGKAKGARIGATEEKNDDEDDDEDDDDDDDDSDEENLQDSTGKERADKSDGLAAPTEALKRPQSAFFLWQAANRDRVREMVGSKDIKLMAAKMSELWKAASADEKASFDAEAKKQKDAFDAYIKTPEGSRAFEAKKETESSKKRAKKERLLAKEDKQAQKEMKKKEELSEKDLERKRKKDEKEEAQAQKKARKDERERKAAVKAVVKDEKLKRPPAAYMLYLNENRERLTKEVSDKEVTRPTLEVSKLGGQEWKALSEDKRKQYEDKAQKLKEEYDAYLLTDEGKAAMDAYKEAVQAAKRGDGEKTKGKKIEASEAPMDCCEECEDDADEDAKLARPSSTAVRIATSAALGLVLGAGAGAASFFVVRRPPVLVGEQPLLPS